MTYDGFCAVALAGTFVMLIAVTVGWTIDNWAGWRDQRSRSRADRAAVRYCTLPAAHFGPCQPSTVQWPSDPSPRPRPDYEWRAIAEGSEQT